MYSFILNSLPQCSFISPELFLEFCNQGSKSQKRRHFLRMQKAEFCSQSPSLRRDHNSSHANSEDSEQLCIHLSLPGYTMFVHLPKVCCNVSCVQPSWILARLCEPTGEHILFAFLTVFILSIRTPLPRTTPVLKFKRPDLVLQYLPRHVEKDMGYLIQRNRKV